MRNVFSVILLAGSLLAGSALADSVAADALAQAESAWKTGRFEQAENAFKQALEQYPGASDVHARLAAFYLSRHRVRDAIEQYQQAITLSPENPRLFVGLAIAYLHQQSYSMARAMVGRALELDPDLANARKLSDYVEAKQRLVTEAHGEQR